MLTPEVNGGRGEGKEIWANCAPLIYGFTPPQALSQLVDNKFHAKKMDKVLTLSTALDTFDRTSNTSNAETFWFWFCTKDKHVIFHTKIINNRGSQNIKVSHCFFVSVAFEEENPRCFRNGKLLAAKQVVPLTSGMHRVKLEVICFNVYLAREHLTLALIHQEIQKVRNPSGQVGSYLWS